MFGKEVQAIYLIYCVSNQTVAFPYFAEKEWSLLLREWSLYS